MQKVDGSAQAFSDITSESVSERIPKNYFSELPIPVGAFAGFMGSIAIMAVVGIVAIVTGTDVWLSPRYIGSALLGAAAWEGVAGIVVGTIIHLVSGVVYGAIFAFIMPKMPRAFWSVAGVLFGLAIWVIAAVGLPMFLNAEAGGITSIQYFTGLIIAHVTYGLFLGVAGSLYGYRMAR